MTTKKIVQVEGKELQLSNLDKVLWPTAGVTKANLLVYHARLFPLTKRHWQGRALTVTRYPHGIEGSFSFKKISLPQHRLGSKLLRLKTRTTL